MIRKQINFLTLLVISMIGLSCNDNDKPDLVKMEIDKYVADNKLKTNYRVIMKN